MSSPEVVQKYIAENEKAGQQNAQKIKEIVRNQIAREEEIIQTSSSFCPNEQLTNRTLRGENIQEALNFGIGDKNILQTLMCINNSAVSFPFNSNFGRNYKIWRYFSQLKQIGTESVSGYAFSTGVREISKKKLIEDPFVVKSPRKNVGSARFGPIHEYFIGAFGTNSLRNNIPNFSFMFGYFMCSPPFIGKKYGSPGENVALTFCQNLSKDNQVMYLIYEKVKNSKPLQEFVAGGCTPGEFLNILIQIVLALNYAYQKMKFSHNDLHSENILIRQLNQPIVIGYPWLDENGQEKTWYLRTSQVATFIDYGRSIIRYPYQGKEEYFGYALPKYGLYPDRSYPMADIYKICMSSLGAALFKSSNPSIYQGKTDDELIKSGAVANPDVYKLIKNIIPYFGPDADPTVFSQYVLESRSTYYTFPYYQKYDQPPISFFQNVLLKDYGSQIGNFISTNLTANLPKYGCALKNNCLSLETAISTYTLMDDDLIADPYTFWEIALEQASAKNIDILKSERVQALNFLTKDRFEIGKKFYLNYLNSGLSDLTLEVRQYQKLYEVFDQKAPGVLGLEINSETAPVIDEYVSLLVQIINSGWIISQILRTLIGINRIYPDLATQRLDKLTYAKIVEKLSIDYSAKLEFINPLINELQRYGASVQKLNIPKTSPVSGLANRLESLIWSLAPMS